MYGSDTTVFDSQNPPEAQGGPNRTDWPIITHMHDEEIDENGVRDYYHSRIIGVGREVLP